MKYVIIKKQYEKCIKCEYCTKINEDKLFCPFLSCFKNK